jgi:hypothetical protein
MLIQQHQLTHHESEQIKSTVLAAASSQANTVHGTVDPERLAKELILAFAAIDAATCPATSAGE